MIVVFLKKAEKDHLLLSDTLKIEVRKFLTASVINEYP